MGLIINFERDSCVPMKFFGGTTLCDQKNSQRIEEDRFAQYGETIGTLTAIPNGYYPPTSWCLPMKAGNMISKNKIIGIGSILTANANMGFDLGGTLSGQGGISQAIGELVADLLATISGTGGISNAELEGIVDGLATLTGSGDITGIIEAIADLQATLTGQGDILADLEAIGEMAATIKGYGDLSVEGLRDAIWNAVASNYNSTGTMGGKLNSAAVGGIDYDALADAVWTATHRQLTEGTKDDEIDTILALIQTIEKLTGNKVTKSGDIITIYESNGITIWKQYNLASGGRVEI